MLWHLGPCWSWRDCPSQGCQLLEIIKDSPASVPFICKPTNMEPMPQTPPYDALQGPSHSGPLATCSNHFRTRYWTTRDSLDASQSSEINQSSQASVCLPYCAHSLLWKTHSCSRFPHPVLHPDWPGGSSQAPSLGICEGNQLFSRAVIFDLLALPYLHSNKIYILKLWLEHSHL